VSPDRHVIKHPWLVLLLAALALMKQVIAEDQAAQ
jgi:hypothetical protein